jgi:hypothetical protein
MSSTSLHQAEIEATPEAKVIHSCCCLRHWRCGGGGGGVAVWRCGGVAVWRCGGVAVWWCGGVAVWRCGGVAVWRCGGVVVWRCGGVAVWRCGGVAVALMERVTAVACHTTPSAKPSNFSSERLHDVRLAYSRADVLSCCVKASGHVLKAGS